MMILLPPPTTCPVLHAVVCFVAAAIICVARGNAYTVCAFSPPIGGAPTSTLTIARRVSVRSTATLFAADRARHSSRTHSKDSARKHHPASVGQAIQDAETIPQLLDVASDMWLPDDAHLASHLATQRVHHEKRQRWASQLLTKLSLLLTSQDLGDGHAAKWIRPNQLERAILAAAMPFDDEPALPEKEGNCISDALKAIHSILGRCEECTGGLEVLSLTPRTTQAIVMLVHRIHAILDGLSLRSVCELRWAIQGIKCRLLHHQVMVANAGEDVELTASSMDLSAFHSRTAELPFDIIPKALDWRRICASAHRSDAAILLLREAIPFSKDTIVTRTGKSVKERRGTAWLADNGIGALAYSGKLMQPQPIPDILNDVMKATESQLGLQHGFFDCVLCNHYPDGDSACKFHTDPEHGTHWDRMTVVVAAGEDRKFAFRPIPQLSQWEEWDPNSTRSDRSPTSNFGVENLAAATHLFSGDLVIMKGACNDLFHHAVHASDSDQPGERVSLVLKRAIDRGGGKRGHSLRGEGRRSRKPGAPRVLRKTSVEDHRRPQSPSRNAERRRRRTAAAMAATATTTTTTNRNSKKK